ncbi:MAG: DNA adenine methylase [Anaerolineales bacterium]|jgi:DNA adenine methylase
MPVQLNFFDDSPDRIINVASVKHRSPFRYPGGKTWLVPRIFQWLGKKNRPAEFIEPFAGGAIVGLTVAFEKLADHVTLVEIDDQVAAVWETIITNGESEWLAQRIEKFNLTTENVYKVLQAGNLSVREKAFQTILQNRTAHGGILAAGAGLLKYGENGKGIASRWYPQTLARRIRDIQTIRDRLSFIHGDSFPVIETNLAKSNAVFFIDPPYTAGNGKRAGSRLYTHFEIDHERLFSLLENSAADFLLTYDNDEYVKELSKKHRFNFIPIAMQNTHLEKMSELLINRDLGWVK